MARGENKLDVIVIGAGVIGLSVALELQHEGLQVCVLERGEPGREASWAAGGMIADLDPHLPEQLKPMAHASARIYPDFIERVQQLSGQKIDFRKNGTIEFMEHPVATLNGTIRPLSATETANLEPELKPPHDPAYFLTENCVDPRDLVSALYKAATNSGVDVRSGQPAIRIEASHGCVSAVETSQERYTNNIVVNCAGAWASQISPVPIVTRPVKGHMLALSIEGPQHGSPFLSHVVRSRFCYIIPRSTGRLVVGSTVEPGGFDKSLNQYRVKRLHDAAVQLVPRLREARVIEAWCGLRPGTSDNLPILGESSIRGYFTCTGHYRDGILLAPISAKLMSDLILRRTTSLDISEFNPARFT